MSEREVYHLRWDKEEKQWFVYFNDGEKCWAPGATKKEAVSYAAEECRNLFAAGTLCQLVVHNKDGRIAFERTYGRDPERRKG